MNQLWKIAVIVIAIAAYFYLHSPYQTKLPLLPQTAASVQSSLDKLKPADRALVEAYMKRSGGGSPDSFSLAGSRLSAKTFAEAIEEQKKFMADTGVQVAQAGADAARNDAAYDSMRQLASVQIIKREILPFSIADVPLSQREDPFFKPPHDGGGRDVLVATLRVKNTTSQTITSLRGSFNVTKPQAKPDDATGLYISCSVNVNQALNPDETKDIACASTALNYISDRDREFVAASSSDYTTNWRPSEINLADGKTIKPPL